MPKRVNTIHIIHSSDSANTNMFSFCEHFEVKVKEYRYAVNIFQNVRPANWDLLIVNLNDVSIMSDLCKAVRSVNRWSPIIIVSRINDKDTIAKCLMDGADDFVTIPYNSVELDARVSVALRRSDLLQPVFDKINTSKVVNSSNGLETTTIEFHPISHEVVIGGVTTSLTQTEYQLLAYLSEKSPKYCTKHELLENVLGYKNSNYTTSLYSHINRLRRKLDECQLLSTRIETTWRCGYRLVID